MTKMVKAKSIVNTNITEVLLMQVFDEIFAELKDYTNYLVMLRGANFELTHLEKSKKKELSAIQ